MDSHGDNDYLCGEADNDYLYYLCFDENAQQAQQDQQDPLSFAEPLSPVLHPLSFAEPLSPAKADADAEWFEQMERPVQAEQKEQHQAVLLAPWGNIINALSLPSTTCNVQPKKERKPPPTFVPTAAIDEIPLRDASMRQQEKLEKEKEEKRRQLNAFLKKKRAVRASGNLPLPKRPVPLTKILPIVHPTDDNVLAHYRDVFNPAGISLPRPPAPKAV